MNAKWTITALVGGALLLGACSDDGDSASSDPVTVTAVDFQYDTREIRVAAGTEITFTNADETLHTMTDKGGSFNTDDVAVDEATTFSVSEPGTYNYFCVYHPAMSGELIIE